MTKKTRASWPCGWSDVYRLLRHLLSFTLFLTPAAHALETVTLQLKWTNTYQFAGYYVALERGYYREAGLDVKILEATPQTDPVAVVLSGQAQFGVGMSSLLLHRYAGQPVVALAVIFQHSPQVLILPEKKEFTSALDLSGRRIMLESHSDELLAFLQNEGVDLAGLRRQPHSFNLKDLTEGRTDAMSAYLTNEPYFLRKQGFAFKTLSPRTSGIDFYGDNLFTSQAEIDSNPERVAAFRKASLRGWREAMASYEPTIALIHERYAPQLETNFLRFEASVMGELMRTDLIEVGYMNPERWQHIADTYAGLGLLPQNFDLHGFLYTAPLPYRIPPWAFLSLVLILAITLASAYVLRLNRRLAQARDASLAANRFKGEFLARVSHDLRTPLNTVMGYGNLASRAVAQFVAQQGDQGDRLKEVGKMLAAMERGGQNVLTLIDELLQFARGEEGHLRLEPRATYLNAMLRDVLEHMQPVAQRTGNTLELVADVELPVVWLDESRVHQVLCNLIANACAVTDGGQITLTVQSRHRTEGNPNAEPPAGGQRLDLHFAVADTGPGIAPEAIEHLFAPFVQGEITSKSNGAGAGFGLGLAICRQLVRLMGSDIDVQSSPQHGSVFSFTLQTTEGNESDVIVVPNNSEPANGRWLLDGSTHHILVVDDMREQRDLMSDILTSLSFDVLQSGSARQAIEQLQGPTGARVELVLTDQVMPDGDGWELLRWCRQNRPGLPVVLLSATPANEHASGNANGVQFNAQLLKPVRVGALQKVLGDQLGLTWTAVQASATHHTVLPVDVRTSQKLDNKLSTLRQLAFEGRGLDVDTWLQQHGAQLEPPLLQELLPLADQMQHSRMVTLLDSVLQRASTLDDGPV